MDLVTLLEFPHITRIILYYHNSIKLLEFCFITRIPFLSCNFLTGIPSHYVTGKPLHYQFCYNTGSLLHNRIPLYNWILSGYQNSVTLLEFDYVALHEFCYVTGILLCHGIPLVMLHNSITLPGFCYIHFITLAEFCYVT